jgi:hypothetical protein
MYRILFITTVVLVLLGNTAIAQADKYVSTGWCRFQQGEWDKEWVPSADAGFTINSYSREIRFDHTTWASHTLKIDRTENSLTADGTSLITYYCTEPANGDKWEVKFSEWTVFDEAVYYNYYQIEIKNPSALMRFMTKKAD